MLKETEKLTKTMDFPEMQMFMMIDTGNAIQREMMVIGSAVRPFYTMWLQEICEED